MRITTNAILRNYKSNLGTSMKNLDTARTRVMTQRKYNSTAEDPSSALRAAILERKYVKNEDYLNIENLGAALDYLEATSDLGYCYFQSTDHEIEE